ncbi:hypothetical protein LTR67_011216 [Exophiala xenobiotica]
MSHSHPQSEKLGEPEMTEARPVASEPSISLHLSGIHIFLHRCFLGYTMIANILYVIDDDVGPSTQIIRVLLVFTVCQTVTFTIFGRLSDIFGRRWYYIGGNLLAIIGFVVVSSQAKTVNVVIGGVSPPILSSVTRRGR